MTPFQPLRCPPSGATIAIIAPAGPAQDHQVEAVPALLAAQGYQARLYPSCLARGGYLAGSDAARLADLLPSRNLPVTRQLAVNHLAGLSLNADWGKFQDH